MPTASFDQRPSGIASAGELPWGSHFCVFYASERELLDGLVPFIKAGLECNEACSWEVRAPLTIEEATRALTGALPDLARYVALGQLEIVSSPESPAAGADDAVERRLDQAILAGFDGLRLVRHAGFAATRRATADATRSIRRLNIIAAFLYPRAELGALDLMRVVQDHRFALVYNSGRWDVLEGSEARTVRDELERSEEKLQSLFRNMSEGFAYHRIVLDGRGKPCDYVFLQVSPAFERLTGLVAEQILGKRVTQVLPGIGTDPADWIGRYGRVALTGEPAQFESHAAALDRWYAVSAFSPHKGYFAVTFADITDRKRAEAERRAAEERLIVTLRSIGDAVIATDTEGRVTLMNGVAESLTGWSEAEARGRPLAEVFRIVNEDTGAPAEDPVRKVIEQGSVVGLANHTALVAKDGRRIAIADSAAPVRGGMGLLGVVLVFRDVTADRQAERDRELAIALAAVQKERQRLYDVLETLPAMICLLTPDYRVAFGNRSFRERFGEPRGRHCYEQCFGLAEPCDFCESYKVLETGEPHRWEVSSPDGKSIIEAHDFPFTDVDGSPLILEMDLDVTERKHNEAALRELNETLERRVNERTLELRQANDRLEDADRRKNEFLAMLSHELRNPLAPISNSLYVLEHAAPGGNQARRAKEVIDRQVAHLSHLVDDLLDVTRVSRNKIQLERRRIDLCDVVRCSVEDQRSLFERGGIDLETEIQAEPLFVNADPTRVAQVVGNLMQNAAKFTRRGGLARVSVATDHSRARAVVRVMDTGVGMAPETLAGVFQPFMQADETLDRSMGGLGLGLALVKGLVELHGGDVSAHSEGLGKGSEFVVTLPLDGAAQRRARPGHVASPRRSRRVLIIEDNIDAADSLRDALELGGHVVAVAYNGPDGIDTARELKPDVVFCDIGLPGMDGYEVARTFQGDPALTGTHLVALSGYALPEDVQRAADAGFRGHLAKPPSIEKLEEVLGNMRS